MLIHFYEKPGCINNSKQKKMLEEHGHTIVAHSILAQSWTSETLRKYFGKMQIKEWFNYASPRIKNGEIIPEDLSEEMTIALMVNDPLLIRRPLINAQGNFACGFDNELVWKLIDYKDISHLQICPNIANDTNCDNSVSKISFDL